MTAKKEKQKTKVCVRCLKRKKLDLFGKNPRMASGRKSYCKKCSADLQREWNAEQRAKKKAVEAEARIKGRPKKKAARKRK